MSKKVGFIFECGREGPDEKVCRHLVGMLNEARTDRDDIEIVAQCLDNKPNMVQQCGLVASLLLQECEHVVIVWDLYPPWREDKPCLHEDREEIFAALHAENVDQNDVSLVCIHEELEAWLIADERALKAFIAARKHPHPVGQIPKHKKPDRVKNPKAQLTKLFNKELGNNRRYIDYQDAEPIVREFPDLKRIKRSDSFRRLANELP